MLQIKDAQTRVNLIFAQPEAARTILETAKGKVKRNPISWIPSFPQIDFIVLFNRFNFKYHTMASYIGLLKKRKKLTEKCDTYSPPSDDEVFFNPFSAY